MFGTYSSMAISLPSPQTNLQELWAYILIVFLVMLEGPATILLASGFSASGMLQPMYVFYAATLGNLIADTLWYALGYYGNIEWLLRLPKFLKLDEVKLNRLMGVINRHAIKLLIFAKVTNGLIVPVLIATGLARVSMRRWFPVIFLTNLVNSAVFVTIGFFMTHSLLHVQQGMRYLAIFAALALVLVAGFYLQRQFSRRDLVAGLEETNDDPGKR
jgi:membrane protein DedA with SNARE-associated domain